MKFFTTAFLLFVIVVVQAQDHGFPFGQVTYKDLNMNTYEKDTSAVAVVLNEFGEAYVDNAREGHLIYQYHAKIKILKQAGIRQGDISISLYHQESRKETIQDIKASSFNIENGSMKEFKLESKGIFTVKEKKYSDETRFAIPNVRVGSVIEIQYEVESPFIFNFHDWEFQSDIPKIASEYWASVPANYRFNITMRGFLPLVKNESEIIKDCFSSGSAKADCSLYKWSMKDIPAFKEEDYMTARSNYLAKINFELSEIKYFDGRTDKITKEWKDAEQELKLSSSFGVQLKRGKSIVDEHVELLIGAETDPLIKAQKIYDFIKGWFCWDELYGKYSELGIKEAFDKKKGNVGDINLALIAALKYGGVNTEAVLLSTRNNGLPTELHPVLSEFNYVIAKANIGDKVYLLDATDNRLPFGMLPKRCLNGKGRVLGEKESYWHELKTPDKSKYVTVMNIKLDPTGMLTGSMKTTYFGYDAFEERKRIADAGSPDAYFNKLKTSYHGMSLTAFKLENEKELTKPLSVTLDIQAEGAQDMEAGQFLFNPFIAGKWDENPFKSNDRLYPVDFASPVEQTFILNLEYPETFSPVDLPQTVGLALPNAGGRYVFDVKITGNRLSMNNTLQLARPVFSASEYHYVKELFSRMVANQQTEFYFKKN